MDFTTIMDRVGELIKTFDPSNFMPDISSVLGVITLFTRIAVLAGPLILFGLGMLYFLLPAKEANHTYGYRCYWGMGSIQAWLFTQKLAGFLWSVLGFIMTMVMALIANGFSQMDMMEMVWKAAKCLVWQGGLVLASIVIINITVFFAFDRKGYPRGSKRRN